MAKMTLDEVRAAVNELTPADKEILIKELVKSETGMSAEVEKAWVVESKRRYEEIIDGKVATVPAEEVFGKIRKARAEGRPVSSLL